MLRIEPAGPRTSCATMLAISARPSLTSVARALARRIRVDSSRRPITTNTSHIVAVRPVEPAGPPRPPGGGGGAQPQNLLAVELLRSDGSEPEDRERSAGARNPPEPAAPSERANDHDRAADNEPDLSRGPEPTEIVRTG